MQLRRFVLAFLSTILATICVRIATAQTTLRIAAGAGIAIPSSDLASDHQTAILGNVKVIIHPNRSWIDVQGDVSYGHFSGKGASSDFRPLVAMGSLTLSPPSGGSIRPYLLGGAGLMARGNVNNSYTRFAVHGGAGFLVGGSRVSGYCEGRYVSSVEAISVASYFGVFTGVVLRL